MQLMSDKTKFIAFIGLHKQKSDKIDQGNVKARAAVIENGGWSSVSEHRLKSQRRQSSLHEQSSLRSRSPLQPRTFLRTRSTE